MSSRLEVVVSSLPSITHHCLSMDHVKIIECPRDAWQGLPKIIPAEAKVAYLELLLQCGFRRIDAISFVSPKHVPQMADSEVVMAALHSRKAAPSVPAGQMEKERNPSKLGTGSTVARSRKIDEVEFIGIIVNEQGFQRALHAPGVTTIGYPYSISERFSRQNANMLQEESRGLVEKMHRQLEAVRATGAEAPGLVVYVSMAFGNPYGDAWNPGIVVEAIEWLQRTGVRSVSLADTVGKAQAEDVGELFRAVNPHGAELEIGVHLHSRAAGAAEKVLAAYEAGCRRFDSALTGLGGCPFAGDELVGNIPTEIVVDTLNRKGASAGIEPAALATAVAATQELRRQYAR